MRRDDDLLSLLLGVEDGEEAGEASSPESLLFSLPSLSFLKTRLPPWG